MSIYATLWSIQVQDPASSFLDPRWVEVTAQAVPPHIGNPTSGYESDPYADFLPPAFKCDESRCKYNRAVVFITNKTEKRGQEYINPLLVLTGEEYHRMPFRRLLGELAKSISSGPPVVAVMIEGGGTKTVMREDGSRSTEAGKLNH